jgi:hypothetical protein
MTSVSRKSITLLAFLVAIILYVMLGYFPNSFTAIISGILLVCGLVLLYLVNTLVGKKAEKENDTEELRRENGNGQ